MARRSLTRIRKSRAGRLPYAFVAVVVLAAMLILTAYYELSLNFTNSNASYNIPEQVQAAFLLAQQEISAGVYQDLMRAEAALLVAGADPDLALLNGSVGDLFSGTGGTLDNLNLTTPLGFVDGLVVVHAVAWGINVTWDEGQVYDGIATVQAQSDANDPYLPLASTPDASTAYTYGETEVPVYPMAVGWVSLIGYDGATTVSSSQTITFSETLQSDIGLLQESADQFSAASSGPTGDFAQLVLYLVTTLGELRALSGYGSGGYLGTQSATTLDGACVGNASRPDWGLLCDQDISDAVGLAEILMSLQYFHDYDPGAAYAFLSDLPRGAYQSLLQTYVTTGTVDGAALYLLLLNSQGGWSDGWISSGEGLAAEVDGFADRYAYDVLNETLGNQTVDPTQTSPVVGWGMVHSMNQANASALLYKWLATFQDWLGVSVTSIPGSDVTATIPEEVGTSGACTYIILPEGTIQVSTNPVPNLANLILGSSYSTDSQGLIELPPNLYNIFENVSLDTNGVPAGYYWSEVTAAQNGEDAGYYFVDESLLKEYDQSGGGGSGAGNTLLPYFDAIDAIINTTTDSMEYKPDPADGQPTTDTTNTGYVNYLADNASHDGNNYTLVQAGLPDLTTAAGATSAIDSTTYSLLTNGSSAILDGPDTLAADHFSTQAENTSFLNDSWLNGAWHANLLPANVSGPGGGAESANPYAYSDISFLTAREWYQVLYGLWYGSAGTIPTTIPTWDTINYNSMDASSYHVLSPGVRHTAPPAFQDPDFAINVMNETYISALDYMGWDRDGGPECLGGGFGNCGLTAHDPANGNGMNPAFATGPAACQAAAYDNALTTYYNEEVPGAAGNTWDNVRGAVLAALTGTPANPGADQIHDMLTSSFLSLRNYTDSGNFDSWNFTNWSLQKVAPYILNDTRALGALGGWLDQELQSTKTAIWQQANESSTITRPYVENQLPYTLWQGNYTAEEEDQQLFNESLRPYSGGLNLTADTAAGGMTLSVVEPTTTVHLVDPQDDASNMGIASYSTTWEISLVGDLSLQLTSERPVIEENTYLLPTEANFTIPLDLEIPVTIYTPWEVSSGWDDLHTPLPGDPTQVQTREVLGLEFHDYHTATTGSEILGHSYAYLPGLYVSPTLNTLLDQTVSVGKVVSANGLLTSDLLSALPDRGVGASAAWSQNLTLLQNLTNTALAATATTGYETGVQATFATLDYALTRPYLHGGPFTDRSFTDPAFFGNAGTLDVASESVNLYGAGGLTLGCDAGPSAASCFGDPYQLNLTFADPQTGFTLWQDNNFNGGAYPYEQGVREEWTGSGLPAGLPWTSSGTFTLEGFWQDFASHYALDLGGGAAVTPVDVRAVSDHVASLNVPYWGPLSNEPATVSVTGVGGLPPVATTAFQDAVGGYLPAMPAFSSYVAEQKYAAADLYDNVGTAPTLGVSEFGYATELTVGPAAGALREENDSVELRDLTTTGGIFNGGQSSLAAFLLWYEQNDQQLAYGIGANSEDPTTLASAEPFLLADTYRNVTWSTGDAADPSTFAYLSANLAFSESDLGGTGGALLNDPTLFIGGGTPGTFELNGELVIT